MNLPAHALRVATYNIHKGVQGIGPARRLEIHNLGHAIEQLDADIVCLQEVRKMNRQAQARFARWPEMPQADFLAPEGYTAVYEIYPGWRARYEPGITHNTEHLFGLCVPERVVPALHPREHTAWKWLPYREAADACFSPSNAEAILLLPEFAR